MKKRSKMKNKLRNFIWTIFGILLMIDFVWAGTTISDFEITTTGNVTASYSCNSSDCYPLVDFLIDTTGAGEDSWAGNYTFYWNATEIVNIINSNVTAIYAAIYNNINLNYTASLIYANTNINSNTSALSNNINLNLTDSKLYANVNILGNSTGTDTNATTECSGTTTYLDGEGNCDDISGVYIDESDEANLNVNSSLSLNTSIGYIEDVNITQMEETGGILNIVISWFETKWDALFGAKSTDDLSEGSTNKYENKTYINYNIDENLTASKLYANINVLGNSTGKDTNASTECSGAEVLLGNTTCWDASNFPVDTDTDTTYSHLSNFTDDILWTSAFNGTFEGKDSDTWDTTNIAFYNKSNEFTENQNFTNHNLTFVQCITFNSGGKICSS